MTTLWNPTAIISVSKRCSKINDTIKHLQNSLLCESTLLISIKYIFETLYIYISQMLLLSTHYCNHQRRFWKPFKLCFSKDKGMDALAADCWISFLLLLSNKHVIFKCICQNGFIKHFMMNVEYKKTNFIRIMRVNIYFPNICLPNYRPITHWDVRMSENQVTIGSVSSLSLKHYGTGGASIYSILFGNIAINCN